MELNIDCIIVAIEQRILVAEPEKWIEFADITGDSNELHRSEKYASNTMFGERIAPGMYTASFISTISELYAPDGHVSVSEKFKFRAPVKKGQTLRPKADILSLDAGILYAMRCCCGLENVLEGDIRFNKDYVGKEPTDLKDELYKEVCFTQKTVDEYLKTLDIEPSEYPRGRVPAMLIGASFSELLLRVSCGKGAYLGQTLNFYGEVNTGQDILLKAWLAKPGKFSKFGLSGHKDGELVANGYSLVTAQI